MPDLSSLTTNFFATPNEGFTTTTSGPVDSSSDTVVPFNSVSGLTNGSIFTGLIDPGNAKERAFTGVVDTGGSQITSVKFTTGTNATHTTGATIVDYVTGTHFGAMTKGIGITHEQSGLNKSGVLYPSPVFSGTATGTYTLGGTPTIQSPTFTGAYSGWVTETELPDTITNNGNRSYDLVFNSTDLTDTLSTGMRLRLTRTVSAPTQCADLESSSSQYFSSASAGLAGMTFTDDFTVIIHVPALESYAAMRAVSRIGASSGWSLGLRSDGRVEIIGYNASYANFSSCLSYQSVPLGKAFDIVAQLDMSAFTATPTTSYIMIDGIDVPAVVSRGGTNPTSLVQQGDLNIGAYNNAAEFFDGKIAQVAIFSAKVTQATARTYLSQGFSGSETNLVSAYSLSNSLLDLNAANNNDLTANGGALATAVDSPFGNHLGGTLEYAIITKTAFSTNTTLTVQVPEGCAIPTSGGVSAVAYSTQATPYGFPREKNKWVVSSITRAQYNQASPATSEVWYNVGSHQLSIPVGSWSVSYQSPSQVNATNAAVAYSTLSTANNTTGDREFVASWYAGVAMTGGGMKTIRRNLSVLSATTYYLNLAQYAGTSATIYNLESNATAGPSVAIIEVECAYL